MHYVVFLLQAGKSPYAQITDINLPGTYLLEFLAMKLFGGGAVGLRIYDGLLCLSACCLMMSLSKQTTRARLIGLGSGLFFLLVHLQDGLAQAGQRDLAMAVLLLLACFFLLRVCPARPLPGLFLFELAIGLTVIVKPTLFAVAFLPCFVPLASLERVRKERLIKFITLAIAGLSFPAVVTALWLLSRGALAPFVSMLSSSALSHGELGRRSLAYLLSHCAAPLSLLLIPWGAMLFILRPRLDALRFSLLFCVAGGLLSYILQGKGYPYHRYPFLALLILLIGTDLNEAFEAPLTSMLALATSCLACLWFAPTLTRDVASFEIATPFETALASDLTALGDTQSIQCLDTFGGCINTLYNLKITQSTGFLYDCYLFEGTGTARDEYRRRFLQAFQQAQPTLLVLTDQDCFTGTPNPDKLRRWPEFQATVDSQYALQRQWTSSSTQHWWHRRERPASYWILRKR